MLVVASKMCERKNKVYHRYGCMYAHRMKADNRKEMSVEVAERKHYHTCKYCGGLYGDVKIHKNAFATWSGKRNMQLQYHRPSDTLYIQTEIGFWKVFLKKESGRYVLYHRDVYHAGMSFKEAICGDFHRQNDVKATESLEKLVDYITAHDRAKVIIMDDYRKLPKSTKQQKKYYKAAERRERKQEMKRLDSIFAALEQSQAGMKRYSIC